MKRISIAETCKILEISNSTLLRQRNNDETFPKFQKKNNNEIFFIEEEISRIEKTILGYEPLKLQKVMQYDIKKYKRPEIY